MFKRDAWFHQFRTCSKLGSPSFGWVRFSSSDPVLSRSSRSHRPEFCVGQDRRRGTPSTHTCETVSCWSAGHTSVALSLAGGCHSAHCRAKEGLGALAGGPLTGRRVPASGGTCRRGGPCSEAGPPAALCCLCGEEFYRRLRTLDPKRISCLSLPGMNGPFIIECPFGSCAVGQTGMEGPL